MSEKILEVRQLATSFHTERGWQQAIDGVSFDVYQGEILGIVGESGCGKSVTSQSIMRLYDERRLVRYSGTVKLEGQSLLDIPFHKMQDIRGSRVSMIFQDALSSLNPVLTICDQIASRCAFISICPRRRRVRRRWRCCVWWGFPRRKSASTSTRTSCPAVCGSA